MSWNDDLDAVVELRGRGMTFAQIGQKYGIKEATARKRWWRDVHAGRIPEIQSAMVGGVTVAGRAADAPVDTAPLWAARQEAFRRELRTNAARTSQGVWFPAGKPACVWQVSDLHLGGDGTDYGRIREEAEIIVDTPNSLVFHNGDFTDNFIDKWANSIAHGRSISVADEWLLAADVLEIYAPKLGGVVGGNHDYWTKKASGVDYLQKVVAKTRKGIIYDGDEAYIDVHIGEGCTKTMLIRHQFRGHSQWNPTHAIEKARRFGRHFDIGVMGHTHRACLARPFQVGEDRAMAVLTGTYKAFDNFPRRIGFEPGERGTAAAVIIEPNGYMFGVERVSTARDIMRLMHGHKREI